MPRARKPEIHWDWPVEYAIHRGVSKQAVYKAIGEGRIQLDPEGGHGLGNGRQEGATATGRLDHEVV